ncbi:MAG: biotin--[acetyl-CoA-carboxylase] ligase, partial [Nitrospinota bacterium]
LLTLVAGVAAAAALERLPGRAPRLKWPNDLRYDGRKAGGILTEARAAPDGISLAVVGIGVNLFQQPEDFPPDIRRTATSVAAATGRRVDRAEAAAAVLDELDAGYRRWLREGFGPVARAWRERASTLGKRVRIIRDGAEVEGRAGDLAEDGALLVETASGTVRVQAGEVAELEETECSS